VIAAAPAALPPYHAQVARLTTAQRTAMTPSVWRPGCPVALGDLRRVTLTYVGFDGRPHRGALVVNRSVASAVAQAFGQLYAARFPIRRMLPIEAYGGSDFRSIEADNTSSFNCRSATGSSSWSEHAYGRAIDLDPIENPYVAGDGSTSHPASRPYVDRARVRRRPGVIAEGGAVLRAFARIGWGWGGRWSGARDYQHLSANGR
jgi:D-alanyl-D-alanine carboxypeptidase